MKNLDHQILHLRSTMKYDSINVLSYLPNYVVISLIKLGHQYFRHSPFHRIWVHGRLIDREMKVSEDPAYRFMPTPSGKATMISVNMRSIADSGRRIWKVLWLQDVPSGLETSISLYISP